MNSPLEQFEIKILWELSTLNIVTNSNLSMLTCLLVWILVIQSGNGNKLIPTRWQAANELFNKSMINLSQEHMGKNSVYVGFISSIFLFIGISNLLGFIPFVFTPSTHLIIALGMSISIWFSAVIIGLVNHQINFFSMWMPSGTPLILAFLLVPIEILSFTARAFSLGLRLCINICTGHLLQYIISDFSYKFITAGKGIFIGLLSLFPMATLLALSFLEVGIILMQSFIFTILTAIYLSEAKNMH